MKSDSSSKDEKIIKVLKELAAHKAAYPPELLTARRAAFMDRIAQGSQVEVKDGLPLSDQEVIRFLQGLKTVEAEYPSKLRAARRTAFRNQIVQMERVRFWTGLRSIFQQRVTSPTSMWSGSLLNFTLTSLIVVSIAAFAGFFIYGSLDRSSNHVSSPNGISQVGSVSAKQTPEAPITCKPGYVPPLCLAKGFNRSHDLTYVGNGSARPAVAKDTSRVDGGIHKAAYVNDGLYGPGASWVSDSPNSWIKIDLGKPTTINTVKFGRDRLGKLKDRNPGQFTIALALADNIYADGNSSNDNVEYRQVFNSVQSDFSGVISGSETVIAQFHPQAARYIKITFEQAGTTIDEVEAFMLKSPLFIDPTRTTQGELLLKTATPVPTNTPLPTDTRIPPTATPLPTNTSIPPTATPFPTNTSIPPTDTPLPTDTPIPPTDTPLPTDTPVPPTDTPVPLDTPIPASTDTPVPADTAIPTVIPVIFIHPDSIHLTAI